MAELHDIRAMAVMFAGLSLAGCSFGPERVEFDETWHFRTATGTQSTSGNFAVVQESAVPFLPGGEVGPTRIEGEMIVNLDSRALSFRPFGPMLLHQMARGENGTVSPPVSLDGLRNEYSTGFARRIRAAQSTIELQRPGMRFMILDVTDGSDMSLDDFEAQNPGVTLDRITLRVTRR